MEPLRKKLTGNILRVLLKKIKDKKKKQNPYATPYWVYIIVAILFILFTWWGGFPIWEGYSGIILKENLQFVYGLIFLAIICIPIELIIRYIRKRKMNKN